MRWVLILWLTLAVMVGAALGAVSAEAACASGSNNFGHLFSTYCQTAPECGWGVCELDTCLGFSCGGGYLQYCVARCRLFPGCWGLC